MRAALKLQQQPFDLAALIRDALASSEIADPRELAATIANEIPDEALRDVTADLLADRVRVQAHIARRAPLRTRSSSARWLAVAERAEDIAIFRVRVCPAGVWKFLGDCTPDDVEALASAHREQAVANDRRAQAYKALRDLMDRKRSTTVRQLPPASVTEILS